MKYIIGNLIVLLFSFSITSAALADDEDSGEPVIERCLSTRALRSPEIIDDTHIVFRASRKRLYLNTLPTTCVGLKRQGRISYQKESNLCENDRFNVLERAGMRLRLGMSCRLGPFELISQEDLEKLREPPAPQPEPKPVELPKVEDVVEDVVED
jgi:hypothetical protein